jgi:asparagine synthase (glutamine-hydrolysing)
MCGIAGIFSFNQRVDTAELKVMTDTLQHRGPDGDGIWTNNTGNLGLGHRRLSIIDLSENGRQPMIYDKGNFTITFNGEIYNYIEIRENLRKKGYQFYTESDTEVLMALYKDKGVNCLADIDGMFAFALWDEAKQQLFCARDRFGEKPFYYFKDAKQFVFASEMKAIFTKKEIAKTPNNDKLFYYLAYNKVQTPQQFDTTYYKNIESLEAAHYLIIDKKGSITKTKYWDIELKEPSNMAFDEACEQFRFLFTDSIKKRLRSDVPVGSCLSGGLDSSSIVRTVNSLKSKGLIQKTFSARFKNFAKDEGDYIQKVVDGTDIEAHHAWTDADSFINHFEKVFYHQEEPFGSASISAQWSVFDMVTKNDVIVLLDGQGADEYLAGYVHKFYISYLRELYLKNDKTAYKTEYQAYIDYFGYAPQLGYIGSFLPQYKGIMKTVRDFKYKYFEHKQAHLNPAFSDSIANILPRACRI